MSDGAISRARVPRPVMVVVITVGVVVLSLDRPAHAAHAPTWQRLGMGLTEPSIRAVAATSEPSTRLYAASPSTVYLNLDRNNWRPLPPLPGHVTISDLTVGPADQLFVATDTGLFRLDDRRESWQQLFRGVNPGQQRGLAILSHPTQPERLFLGTASGLLTSSDGGQHWQLVDGSLPSAAVRHVTAHPARPSRIYALTDRGLYVSERDAESWRLLFAPGPAQEAESPEEPLTEDPSEEADACCGAGSFAIDPDAPDRLYLATHRGAWVSDDAGLSWQTLPLLGLGTDEIRHLFLLGRGSATLYAATANGIARFDADARRWQLLDEGLPTRSAHRLAALGTSLVAATDQGVFMLEPASPSGGPGVLADFAHEPSIGDVHRQAIRYADVEADKIRRWRRQAAVRALLPTFHISGDRNHDTYVTSIGSTTNPAFDRVIRANDPSTSLDYSLSWDLGDLLWNGDQTSIDTRSRLTTQLRDDILDKVTRAYFDRRRLQTELLMHPPADEDARVEKTLKLQELTATLDGLTGAWFSHQLGLAP